MMRSYYNLPNLPDAGLLTRYLDTFGVIVPLARTNLVTNPSAETALTGYTAVGGGAAVAQVSGVNAWGGSASFYGVYGIGASSGGGANDGLYWGPIALTAGVTYAYSCMVVGAPGVRYKASIATTGAADLVVTRFTGVGVWQWIWGIWTETSSTTRRFYITRDNNISAAQFIVDGLQIESCADGFLVPTTYIDGDQAGLVPNQYPPAYGWAGTPHASTSYRTGQTRAGGRVLRFKSFGFLLTAIIGLGMAPPDHQALTFAQLDGGQYENTLKPPRVFSLAGRWAGRTPNELDAGIAQLGRLLDRDRVGQRQPLVLMTQAQECGEPCGEPVQVQALYSGGLEGNVQELPSAAQGITFTQYLPFVQGPSQGIALDVQDSVANGNYILLRSPDGIWSSPGTGLNGYALVVAYDLKNNVYYVGGDFTTAGGVAANRIAKYDPAAGTWSALGSGANNIVSTIAIDTNGDVYAGGDFTAMGGVANTSRIAKWNGSAWSALGTGALNNSVQALAFDNSRVLFAGGLFTQMGGVANTAYIAKWNGSAWSALGTGMNVDVYALTRGPNGNIYVGGGFTTGNGVTLNGIGYWNGTTFVPLGSGTAGATITVRSIAFGLDGTLYAGGFFTAAGGVSAAHIARWNGVGWTPLGSGANSDVYTLAVALNGLLYAGGTFNQIGGIDALDGAAVWNGSAWVSIDIDLPGTPTTYHLSSSPNGTLSIGWANAAAGTAIASGTTTALNNGTAYAYPRLTIRGPSSGASRIYQIVNTTTGAAIYFNYTINAGETAVLTLDPKNITFVSTFRGNILNTILPGSNTTSFLLQPGNNTISFFAANSSVTATLDWQIGYASLNDALQVAAP